VVPIWQACGRPGNDNYIDGAWEMGHRLRPSDYLTSWLRRIAHPVVNKLHAAMRVLPPLVIALLLATQASDQESLSSNGRASRS
jgi:hypothetical protein